MASVGASRHLGVFNSEVETLMLLSLFLLLLFDLVNVEASRIVFEFLLK